MVTKAEKLIIKKAMAYDLFVLLDKHPEKQSYTIGEITDLLKTLIGEAEQK